MHFETIGEGDPKEDYSINSDPNDLRRSIPIWYDNKMEGLLSIRCYMCNELFSDNFEPIIISEPGRKIFRIETRCSECKKIKSKKFCDTFNKLPH